MRCLMLAALSVGALSCSDDPPVTPDAATRAQTTSADSTQRSSSPSYRFVKPPVVVYTAVPPKQPDSFDYLRGMANIAM